jgi:hypothetical protein
MSDEKDKLISEQQLKIRKMESIIKRCYESADRINSVCVCIGGPLNDNKKGYTSSQLDDFYRISADAESIVYQCNRIHRPSDET